MCENTQGKTSKGMGKGRRKQARQWRQEDKLQNIGLWKKKLPSVVILLDKHQKE